MALTLTATPPAWGQTAPEAASSEVAVPEPPAPASTEAPAPEVAKGVEAEGAEPESPEPVAAKRKAINLAELDVAPEPVKRTTRERRKVAIHGYLGWNSLPGLGVGVSCAFIPQLSADLAFGVGSIGLKGGLRLRYNVLNSNWTPVLATGLQLGPGSGSEPITLNGRTGSATVRIESSAFLQMLGGVSFQGDGGFSFLLGGGYSLLLDRDNVHHVSGSVDTANEVRNVVKSGLVVEAMFGYAF